MQQHKNNPQRVFRCLRKQVLQIALVPALLWLPGTQLLAQDASAPGTAATAAPLQRAQALADRRQYVQAESVLQQFVRQDSHSADALYLLAFVQQRQNRAADSLRTYTAAAALRTPGAEQLRQVALDYVLLNDYPDAGHWLERAVRMDARNSESWYDFARVRMHDGNFTEAARLLRRSLDLRPGSSKAWDNLGVCLEAENDSDGAEQAYRKAVATADLPGEANAQSFLDYGTLLNTRNGFPQAVPLLQRAAALAPADARAAAELGRAYLGLGETANALSAMQRAVSLDPANSRLHYQLGRIYRAAGQPQQAQQEFQKSAALYGGKSAE